MAAPVGDSPYWPSPAITGVPSAVRNDRWM